ncbi:MAG: hypothetical protein GX154_00925, partial [Clostridiales bacterium]|nr:hypothetical protein [Clostridiales bacterium]
MTIENVNVFNPKNGDNIFFDTNILLDLFAPGNFSSSHARVSIYADFLKRSLSANAHLVVLSHNISEFYNRLIRFDYNLRKNKSENYEFKKDYKPSRHFMVESTRYIKIINSQILRNFELRNDDAAVLFSKLPLRFYESFDFNDFLFSSYSNYN